MNEDPGCDVTKPLAADHPAGPCFDSLRPLPAPDDEDAWQRKPKETFGPKIICPVCGDFETMSGVCGLMVCIACPDDVRQGMIDMAIAARERRLGIKPKAKG